MAMMRLVLFVDLYCARRSESGRMEEVMKEPVSSSILRKGGLTLPGR